MVEDSPPSINFFFSDFTFYYSVELISVSDCAQSICNVVLGGVKHELKGTVRKGGGKGGEGEIQFTANQWQVWTNIRTTTQRRGFQVSKMVNPIGGQRGKCKRGEKGGLAIKRFIKGCDTHVPSIVYIVLIKAVFRL
jgi:hypothetical protein